MLHEVSLVFRLDDWWLWLLKPSGELHHGRWERGTCWNDSRSREADEQSSEKHCNDGT